MPIIKMMSNSPPNPRDNFCLRRNIFRPLSFDFYCKLRAKPEPWSLRLFLAFSTKLLAIFKDIRKGHLKMQSRRILMRGGMTTFQKPNMTRILILKNFLLLSNPILLSAAPQGGLVDAENFCGILKGFCRRQNPPDVFLFDFLDGNRIAEPCAGISRP